MYKWVVFIISMVLMSSCEGPSSVPGNVIGYNEMKGILWDMSQVDEFVMVYVHGTPQKVKANNLLMYQEVFELHKISNKEFIKSYSFYKSHPLQQKVLMDSLLQFSSRQRQDRYTPSSTPIMPSILLSPAPMRIGNLHNDWHQYQFQTNFSYEQSSR
jgi:hypothetical protein